MSRSIACIDYRDGKIFIAKRQKTGDMGGRWEFPGGKIEEGEDLVTAVVREMQEEFGVTVSVGRKITSGTFMHKEKPCYSKNHRQVRMAKRDSVKLHTGTDRNEHCITGRLPD